MDLDLVQSIIHSKQDVLVEYGAEVNGLFGLFGEKIIHQDKSKKILKKSPMKLNVDSIMGMKESLKDSMFKDMSNIQLFENQNQFNDSKRSNDVIGEKALFHLIMKTRMKFEDWESNIEKTFDEEDVLSIESMISYLQITENGYSKYNDEILYKDEMSSTNSHILLEEAQKGWKLLKASKILKKKFPIETSAIRDEMEIPKVVIVPRVVNSEIKCLLILINLCDYLQSGINPDIHQFYIILIEMSITSLSESFPLPNISKYPIFKSTSKSKSKLPRVKLDTSTQIIIYDENFTDKRLANTSQGIRDNKPLYLTTTIASSPRITEEKLKSIRNEASKSPILKKKPTFINSFTEILENKSSDDLSNLLPGMANQSTQTISLFEGVNYKDIKDYRAWMNDVVDPFFKDFKKKVLTDKPNNLIEYCTAYCLAKANDSPLPIVIAPTIKQPINNNIIVDNDSKNSNSNVDSVSNNNQETIDASPSNRNDNDNHDSNGNSSNNVSSKDNKQNEMKPFTKHNSLIKLLPDIR